MKDEGPTLLREEPLLHLFPPNVKFSEVGLGEETLGAGTIQVAQDRADPPCR